VARFAHEGKPVAEARSAIREVVGQHLSVNSAAKKGNSQKATCILMRTWVTVPEKTVALRDCGLRLFETADRADRLALHWGMCMVAYPFFSMVAESTGRLLRLQSTVAQAQILRRVWDQIGERETVTRAAQRVLRSFADWGALEIIEKQGSYKSTRSRVIENPDLGGWLIEASLLASGEKLFIVLSVAAYLPVTFSIIALKEQLKRWREREQEWRNFAQGVCKRLAALEERAGIIPPP